MNTERNGIPLILKLSQIIMGIIGIFFILYIGRSIIVPIIFATIFAILLNPIVNYLNRKNCNRIFSISVALIIAIILIACLVYFVVTQISKFTGSMPLFEESFGRMLNDVLNWFSAKFSISKSKIDVWVQTMKDGTMNNSAVIMGQTISGVSNLFAFIFLLPVYMFMILYYKPLLLEFIARLFKKAKHNMVAEVLVETKGLITSYLTGLLLETVIIAVMNCVGFLLLGIKYAILLGIVGAILNIIPYIGGLIGLALPVIMALATQSSSTAIYVVIVYSLIQFIDNNVIVPRIVASKVRINALVSLVVVLIGGALWGIPGMFLSIPVTAILKVIFDRIEAMKPFGFLIGDNQPEITKVIFNFGRVRINKPVKPKPISN